MPKEMGGTPKRLSRTLGGVSGEEKWRLDRTSAAEEPSGAWRIGESMSSVPPAHLAQGSLLGS